ncbi:MAG: dihydroneopterin aldolase [Nitrospiria bacterium]
MDKLAIYQIEFHGHCGVTEAERSTGQRLSVDIEMTCDLKKAAETDRLEETIDYDRLCAEIVKMGKEQHLHLIETLADRITDKVLENQRIDSVLVRVKKLLPPREEIRGGVVIETCRRRPSQP